MSKPSALDRDAVLVVGASGAIGAAVARQLLADGRPVGLHYRSNAAAVTPMASAAGTRASLLQAALDDEPACNALADRFIAAFPQASGLAVCSGEVGWRDWRALEVADWNTVFFQHCIAPFLLARRLLPHFEKRGGGSIVYLSSISPKYGGSEKSLHYAAAKAALETAMLGLAKAVAASAIRINGVRAGLVDTPQQQAGRTPAELAARIEKIPLRRAGTPDEIASAFSYLLSDSAAFVTAQLLTVAGGD